MNSCSFFGIKIIKIANDPVAIRQTTTTNGDLMVSFWGQEKGYNAYVNHLFKAFGDTAKKIVNMGLCENIRVNVVAQAEKYDKEGKYSFKITSIDYADPKPKSQAGNVTGKQTGKLSDPKFLDVSSHLDIFSQLLPEDLNLI